MPIGGGSYSNAGGMFIPPEVAGGVKKGSPGVLGGAPWGGNGLPSETPLGGGLIPPKGAEGMVLGGINPNSPTGGVFGGVGGAVGVNSLPTIPTPVGGLPPGISPVQGPGSLLGVPPVSSPRPAPMGGLPGGRMNSTQPPMKRNGGIGGVAPRPAQGNLMRGIRGRGGMSMF